MRKIKNIIWDYNGTLLDDLWLSLFAINKLLSERNLAILTETSYREVFDFPVKDYYRRIGFNFEKESFETVGSKFIDLYYSRSAENRLHTEAREMLAFFEANKYKQFILSAAKLQNLERELNMFEIRHYFEQISALTHHYATSKTENGLKMMQNCNLNSAETLLIGDTLHDYETARALNISCVLYAKGHQSIKKLKQCNVPIINNLSEITNYLEQ